MKRELDRLLDEASALVGCSDVALRCSCKNLEVVYLERRDGRLLVTDRGETFRYLSLEDDSTYDRGLLDENRAHAICREHRVELDASEPETFPRIQRELSPPDDDAAAAVTAVAAAVEAVIRAATRPELR